MSSPPPMIREGSNEAAALKSVDNNGDNRRDDGDDFCCFLQDCAYTKDWERLRSYLDTLLLQQQSLVVENPAHIITAIQDVLFVQSDNNDCWDEDNELTSSSSSPPPVDIIQRLYYIVGGKDILMMRHVVTGECLLSYWIQRGFVISRPLFRFLLSVAPELALQTHRYDDDNLTVIQVLTRQYGAVLQVQYDRRIAQRHQHELPFWNMAYHIVHMMIQATNDSTSSSSSRSASSRPTTSDSSTTSSRQRKDVVAAAVVKTPQHDMLRTCLRVYRQLPKSFLQLVLQHYWEQLCEPDEAGRYPLHILCADIAAAAAAASQSLHCSSKSSKDSWLLQQIVQGYPHAARIAAVGVKGAQQQQQEEDLQLPLQLALTAGRRLNECAGMQALVSCYPEALFLNSNSSSSSLHKNEQQQQQKLRHRSNASDGWMVTQLASQQRAPTAVFEILRTNPDLIIQ